MIKPVRTTIVFGLASGLFLLPVAWLTASWGWPMGFQLTLWILVTIYALLLARWSRTGLLSLVFPLGILLGAALWPQVSAAFFLLGLGIFSWIRSGICFNRHALRGLMAEVVTVGGAAALVAMCRPTTPLTWAVAIWLFFLVQALYFLMVPGMSLSDGTKRVEDPFQTALREAERAIES
jgi:hypothetical protein